MIKQKIAAGIVLFNPNIDRLKKNIDAILPQVEVLYIIDNNSDNIDLIEKYLQNKNTIILQKNSENFGIAKALNQMCNLANLKGFDWILTLDQD
ncbi:MAG: glycosyltransferase, partial [Mobilitalea sp.]